MGVSVLEEGKSMFLLRSPVEEFLIWWDVHFSENVILTDRDVYFTILFCENQMCLLHRDHSSQNHHNSLHLVNSAHGLVQLLSNTLSRDSSTRKMDSKAKVPGNKSATPSTDNIPPKSAGASKASPDRKLAGRSPMRRENGITDVVSKGADTCGDRTCGHDGDFSTYACITPGRGLVINEDKQTQTSLEDFCLENEQASSDMCSSVELHCRDYPKKSFKRRIRDYIYDEDHGLCYADDLSGEEYDTDEYENAKAYLEYEAQFDDLRTEFSIDDVTDPDKLLDEWENVEFTAPAMFSTQNRLSMLPFDDDLESLYSKAEDIFKRMNVQGQEKGHVEVLREMSERIKAHSVEEEQVISRQSSSPKEDFLRNPNCATPMNSPPPHSALISSPECQEEGDGGNRLGTITEYSIRDEGFAGEAFVPHGSDLQKENDFEADWEQPRSLNLSNSRILGHHGESLITQGDDIALFEHGKFTFIR
ncbi:hypothetical protein Y032_0176g539 [Ancylostoma ceylanicum]|uniref:Uncharacterized protein n=2 Tax=Ancylostoma ceylanicum TaxID=53326 RepID=A0A016SUI7_9BILA|nr:hypothetical protein Y032_0176g539 [Ancylostoma ceylanicum]